MTLIPLDYVDTQFVCLMVQTFRLRSRPVTQIRGVRPYRPS